MNRFLLKVLGLSGLLLSGCATVVDAQAPAESEFPIRPPLQVSERSQLMYQILAAEVAGKREQLDVALEYYQQVAMSSSDAKIVERAALLALLVKDHPAALRLARHWQTLAPNDDQARQALALALLRNGQASEALDLLDAIREHGSISAAARAMDMSYRRAWLLVDVMNRCWREPLVETSPGSSHGGGARVKPMGEAVLTHYRALQARLSGASDCPDQAALTAAMLGVPRKSQKDA